MGKSLLYVVKNQPETQIFLPEDENLTLIYYKTQKGKKGLIWCRYSQNRGIIPVRGTGLGQYFFHTHTIGKMNIGPIIGNKVIAEFFV